MRLTRYLPSACEERDFVPGSQSPGNSVHSEALLTRSELWPIEASLSTSRTWDPNRRRKSPSVPACWEDAAAIKLWNKRWQANNKTQPQTAICLSGFEGKKGPPASRGPWQGSQGPRLLNKRPVLRFLQVPHCLPRRGSPQSQNSCTMQRPLNGPGAFHSDLVWFFLKKKKSTKLVFFCALQRQCFSGSEFKTHGLLGEARWTIY